MYSTVLLLVKTCIIYTRYDYIYNMDLHIQVHSIRHMLIIYDMIAYKEYVFTNFMKFGKHRFQNVEKFCSLSCHWHLFFLNTTLQNYNNKATIKSCANRWIREMWMIMNIQNFLEITLWTPWNTWLGYQRSNVFTS